MPPPGAKAPAALPSLKAKQPRLNEEDMQKSLQRLYEHPCERKKMKADADKREIEENAKKNVTVKKRGGPTERDQAICQRLYDTPIIQQKNTMSQLEQRHYAQLESSKPQRSKLTDEQCEETVHRLYAVSVEHKKTVRDKVEKKVYGEAPAARKLDSETLKENVQKLYQQVISSIAGNRTTHHTLTGC